MQRGALERNIDVTSYMLNALWTPPGIEVNNGADPTENVMCFQSPL